MPARALGFASGLTIPGNVDLTQFVGSMVSNITAANSAVSGLRANITAANSAIITANVGMKTYVDTSLASALIAASSYGNSVVAAYLPVDSTITAIQANVTAASANITSTQSNVTAANLNIASTQSNVTAANLNIASTQSNVTAANLSIIAANFNITTLQFYTQYLSSNINGSIFSGNIYTGNLVVGNINASGNLVMTGIDATTIRFVRSPDTIVTSGEIYGNIDFAGEDTGGPGVRARLSVQADGVEGQTRVRFYTGALTPSFTVNSNGYYGGEAGFITQVVPQLNPYSVNNFSPIPNDGSSYGSTPYISSLNTSFVNKVYGVNNFGFQESEAAQEFVYTYGGFAGGDRANINLGSYVEGYGAAPLLWNSFSAVTNVDLEISVQGVYTADIITPLVQKRLRKRWLASIMYFGANSSYIISDQQLQDPVYNSDVTNWPAGAVGAGKVFLQANATVGSQALYLRLDIPTDAGSFGQTKWRWVCKFRNCFP
jgi:hypothetical protein